MVFQISNMCQELLLQIIIKTTKQPIQRIHNYLKEKMELLQIGLTNSRLKGLFLYHFMGKTFQAQLKTSSEICIE